MMEFATALVNYTLGTSTAGSFAGLDARMFRPYTQLSAGPDLIEQALQAAGDLAKRVSEETTGTARTLLKLLADRVDPEATVEPSGEIALEWYRDRHHLVVVTVQGSIVKWAGMLGKCPVSGSAVLAGVEPVEALKAVRAAA